MIFFFYFFWNHDFFIPAVREITVIEQRTQNKAQRESKSQYGGDSVRTDRQDKVLVTQWKRACNESGI